MKKVKSSKRHRRKKVNSVEQASTKRKLDWGGAILIVVVTAMFAGSFLYRGAPWYIGVLFGLFVTFVGLPYLDPQRWQARPVVCGLFGSAFAFVLGFSSLSVTVETSIILGVVGFVIGFYSLKWVPYLSL